MFFVFQMDHHFLAGKYQDVEDFADDQYECMAQVDFQVLSYLVKECGESVGFFLFLALLSSFSVFIFIDLDCCFCAGVRRCSED
jgi:hypothetical protein